MKKLLSICFLSIFLMMFSAQAQVDCCFQLSNPAADTLHNIANLPNGDLPLTHTMNVPSYGGTDTYDLIFSDANCMGIDPATGKVSIELELWCDGENVLDGQHDLSLYCDITLQTTYNELHWIGAPMVGTNYPYAFEYPGAVKIFTGTYNISNVNFDYFYFNFLVNSKTKVMINWHQVFANVQLIAHVRERIHGTDNEFYWDDQQRLNLGGHQSHPRDILASDTLSTIRYATDSLVIKDCEPVTVGMPAYSMDSTGIYHIAYVDTSCGYRIDSVVTYDYTLYVHPTTPTLSDSTYRYCQKGDATPIVLDPEPNTTDLGDHIADIVPYWYFAAEDSFYYAASFTPKTDTIAGIYEYYVKRHDNVTGCESEIDTFHVTILANPADPHVTDTLVENCVGENAITLSYPAPTGQQVLWGTTADNITSTTAPVTDTTVANTIYYYLKLQDTTTTNKCVSEGYDSIKVIVYDNPTVAITIDNDTLCFDEKASMSAAPTTLTTYQWTKDGVNVTDSTNTTFSYTNDVTDTTTFTFAVVVTEKHVVKSCTAKDTVDVLTYPEIGAPTAVRGDTAICGPGTITREVRNGAHASTSQWYDRNKQEIAGAIGTTYTKNYTVTDTLYVSSLNDFGCETPEANWTRIIVRVDSVPQITLTTDHSGDSVCAEEDLIIRSSVIPAGVTLAYEWNGTGLVAPLYEDSVTFNYATAGTYTDTLKVTIVSTGCFNHATIDITVDTLPVIQIDENYTVNNSTFCVGANGKIEFTTPDYVRYSIDSALTWRTTKVFDTLAAGNYYLVVEDGRGCKNHANLATIIKDTINPTLTITDSANTRCEAEFNGKLFVSVAPAAADGVHAYKYQLNDATAQLDSLFAKLENGNTYKITVTDTITGCKTDSLNQVVTDGRVTPVLTLVQNPNTHCIAPFGGSIAVTAMHPADSTYQYKLSTAPYLNYQDDTLFTGLEHGFYTVYARDVNSACVGSDTITVKSTSVLPTATISARPEICYGDTNLVTMVPGGLDVVFDYWTYSGPVPSTDPMVDTILHKQTFSMKGFPAGKHNFTAHFLDTVTHCTNTTTDTLRVIPVNIDLITIPYNAHVCSYDSLKVFCRYFPDDDKDTIVTYNWYAREYHYAGGFDTVWVSPTYNNRRVSIVVYDNHGCSNSKFVDLDVWPLPTLTINVDEQNYCQNATSNITVVPSSASPYEYSWKKDGSPLTGETSNNLAIPVGTTDFDVTVTVKDAHQCVKDSTFSVNVIEIPSAPLFSPDTQYFCDNSVAVDTTHRATVPVRPNIGTFTWITSSPNVEKVSGTYIAYYVNTENSVSCYSEKDTVVVDVTGAPVFTATMKYNSETSASTSHARCYDLNAGDTIHINVTPAPSATFTYTYKRNSSPASTSKDMVVTRTEPGVYVDTIYVTATEIHSATVECTKTDTLYYTITVNALPAVPANFPNRYGTPGDSTIFYCEGSTAVYNFTLGVNQTATYNGLTTAPTTEYDNVVMVITDTMTHCSNTFKYDIVEVKTPKVVLTSDLSDDCGDTLRGKVVATVTPTYVSTYERIYTWTPANVDPASPHSKYVNTDTITYTFRAPNDTIVSVNVTVNAVSGPEASYSASCPSNDTSYIVKFQPKPDKPQLKSTVTWYADVDSAAYCAGESISITAADFTTSAVATVSIVGITTITTAGEYKVVANNNDAPNCPSDTLYFKVHEKRTPVMPDELKADKYNGKIYYCADAAGATYNFTPANTDDVFSYLDNTSVLLADKPLVKGSYFLRVTDSQEGCYADFAYVIDTVSTPKFLVTMKPAAQWKDEKICETSNHYDRTFSQQVTLKYTRTTGAQGHAWRVWDAVDSAFDTPGYSHHYDFDVTKDTILTFIYSEYDTIGNMGYGVTCPFWWSDTISLTYFPTPTVPVYNGKTDFCYGDSIVVGVDSFTLATSTYPTELYSTVTLPVTYKTVGTHSFDVQAQYTSFTSCKSTANNIVINGHNLPSVSAAADKSQICFDGDTATLSVTGTATSYLWSTATIDTVAQTTSIKVTDTVEYTVTGTDANSCVNKATVKVSYYPIFTIEFGKDTTVCVGDSVMVSATVTGSTGPFELNWYKDSVIVDSLLFTDAAIVTGFEVTHKVGPDSSAIVAGVPVPTLFKIMVEDDHGCKMSADANVIEIAATNRPGFEFRMIDSTKTIRRMLANSGDQSGFEMKINQNCGSQAERVFVDVRIYKDGKELSTAELGTFMDFIVSNYNTSYEFEVTHDNAPALESVGIKSCMFSDADYFFPNSEFINYNSYNYDWLYMHFLDKRKITVRTGAWKPGSKGVYTFSFAVIKAGPHTAEVGQVYKGSSKVGGYNGHVNLTVKDTVAFDTFEIWVDTTFVGSSSANMDNNTIVTTAPEEKPAEAKAIKMNVYPNPASNNVNVVLEGISGQTVITVHDMSGKAVSSMRVDVDNNGQVFNLPVDDYSQGIYFIKAVNGSAVMTKKLIIAR